MVVVVVVVGVMDRFKTLLHVGAFSFLFRVKLFQILSSLKIKAVVFQHRGIVKTRISLMCARK